MILPHEFVERCRSLIQDCHLFLNQQIVEFMGRPAHIVGHYDGLAAVE